jgi:hypothetical protein
MAYCYYGVNCSLLIFGLKRPYTNALSVYFFCFSSSSFIFWAFWLAYLFFWAIYCLYLFWASLVLLTCSVLFFSFSTAFFITSDLWNNLSTTFCAYSVNLGFYTFNLEWGRSYFGLTVFLTSLIIFKASIQPLILVFYLILFFYSSNSNYYCALFKALSILSFS